jgi:hypothetical protein
MHLKRLRDLAASARGRCFGSEAEVNQWLDEQRLYDPLARISLKLELMAQGELSTDQGAPTFHLATDRSQYRAESQPVSREMQTWLRRAGLDLTRTYTEQEVTEAFERAGLDTTARMSVRAELYDRQRIRASADPATRPGLQAAAEHRPRGTLLRNADGTLRTLKGCSW